MLLLARSTRAGLFRLLVVTLGCLLVACSPTPPAQATTTTYAISSQWSSVVGRQVTVSITVRASRQVVANPFFICVWDTASKDHSFPVQESVPLTTTGTTLKMTKSFAPGIYRYWLCGGVEGTFTDLSPKKQFTVAGLATAPGQPAGVPGTWRPIFVDDFDAAGLDTSKWSTGWFGDGVTGPVQVNEDACYDPDLVQVPGNGALSLVLADRPSTCSGRDRRWSTGIVTTNGKFSYTYGALEARIYLPPNDRGVPANWPALWSSGQTWPQDGENDTMESMGGQTGPHFHSTGSDVGFAVDASWTGWHTYGSVWEPGKVSYYYDGILVGTITAGVTGSPQYLILSHGPATDGSTVPATMKVASVRVWQR